MLDGVVVDVVFVYIVDFDCVYYVGFGVEFF